MAILIPFVLLSACGTSRTQEVVLSCPPALTAKIDPEPVATATANIDPDEATVFIASELLPWARKNAERLDQGRAWCLKK